MPKALQLPLIPNMNYANMIEEKKLKKTFIIATLVSTIVGTFTSSMGLYERVNSKRKQKAKDSGQDDKIDALQKQLTDMEERSNRRMDERLEVQERRALPAPRRRDELEDSLQQSGPMIRREFERDVRQYGDQFAVGDVITQTQLQSQIITLQQTVISVLQDALDNDRRVTQADMAKLYKASEKAREGTLQALSEQQTRMLMNGGINGGSQNGAATTVKSIKGTSVKGGPGSVVSSRRSASPPRKIMPPVAQSTPALIDTSPLFCRYSHDVQQSGSIPLAPNFLPGGDNVCPACDTKLPVEPGRAWKIIKEIEHVKKSTPEYDDVLIEERTFHLNNRFVIKCHRPNAQFACALCFKNRGTDTIWETPSSLVKHVWRAHEAGEYDNEPDIRELS